VGHMPDLSELASYLLTGNRNLHVEFKKGSVCAIEVSSLPPRGPGLLRWLATPKQLRLMNKGK
jgi:phosphohistidine phosphatase SixA